MGLFTKDKKITGQVITVNVREIDLNPNQPRKYFDKAELESLAISIKENGLLQPLKSMHLRRYTRSQGNY